MGMNVMRLAAAAAIGLTLSLGAYGADENRTKEVSVSVKNENKVIQVEGSRDSTTADPTVQRVRMRVTDGTISEIKNPKCNQNATWRLTDGGLGKRNVEWLERLPEKPNPGAYCTKFENETLMDGGEGNGEPKKYKWAAEENHNIYNVGVEIIKTVEVIYANAGGAVPVRFRILGLGTEVSVESVDLLFSIGNAAPIKIKNAIFANKDGYNSLYKGGADEYTAWVPIEHFNREIVPHRIYGNCQVELTLHNVKGRIGAPSSSPRPYEVNQLISKPITIKMFADNTVKNVVNLGCPDNFSVSSQSGVAKYEHMETPPYHLFRTYLCDDTVYPHICPSSTCLGPSFKGKTGFAGIFRAFDEHENLAKDNGNKYIQKSRLYDDSDWLKDPGRNGFVEGELFAAKNHGKSFGITIDFSYPLRYVQELGGLGMDIDNPSRSITISMFNEVKYDVAISGVDSNHLIPIDNIDATVDYCKALLTGSWADIVADWAKEIMHAYDHKNANTSLKNVALVGVKRYWRVYRPGQTGPKRDDSHPDQSSQNNCAELCCDADYIDNVNKIGASADMTRSEVRPNAGDTWIGTLWVDTEVRAACRRYSEVEISAEVEIFFPKQTKSMVFIQ